MNFSQLDPKEIEYISTLEWEPLMIYLEKKYGIEFKEDFVTGLKNKIQNQFDEAGEKWKN
ncbi:MAG: hypothetical protein H8D35_07625 [Nitrosopumilus sp.]|jgi:hypothetical protein|nr:hypothetical protein [Nitrosopumilus sp.]